MSTSYLFFEEALSCHAFVSPFARKKFRSPTQVPHSNLTNLPTTRQSHSQKAHLLQKKLLQSEIYIFENLRPIGSPAEPPPPLDRVKVTASIGIICAKSLSGLLCVGLRYLLVCWLPSHVELFWPGMSSWIGCLDVWTLKL